MEVYTLTDSYYWKCTYCNFSMSNKREVEDKLPWIIKCGLPERGDEHCIHRGNCVFRTDNKSEHFDYEYQKSGRYGFKVCIHLKVFTKKKK